MLTALVMVPIFKEVSMAETPEAAPSPMTLSRWDEWTGVVSGSNNLNANYGLYPFNDPHGTPYPRAYWTPGIGIFQYDVAGVGAPFTAAEMMNVQFISGDVAAGMAARYCAAGGDGYNRRAAAWRPWSGLNGVAKSEALLQEMVGLGRPAFSTIGLVEGIDNAGGMQARTCLLGGVATECHYVDPSLARGANWWATDDPSGGAIATTGGRPARLTVASIATVGWAWIGVHVVAAPRTVIWPPVKPSCTQCRASHRSVASGRPGSVTRRIAMPHPAIARSARTVAGAIVAAVLVAGSPACSDDGPDADEPAGDVMGVGDEHRATIRRTDGGVPHISGESLADVAFGQGWANGEDRACDLADQVLKVQGARARWWGPGDDDANIDSDVAWRAIGIADRAADEWGEAPDEIVELITAFTAGWNAQLDEVGVDGLAGWCAGAAWVHSLEPVDVYTYARAISLQASSGALANFVASAAPPGATAADEAAASSTDEAAASALAPASMASNGWAIGADRSAEGGGMLVANPHFPWEGELRFWEVHLTIPGELDAYGAQLSGVPGIGIGFTEDFGWTHTVSAGNRFTAYRLDLVPGSPTTYRYGDESREMTPTEHTIEVLGADGRVTETPRTSWASHYGPIIDFPGFGWTDAATITFRDANIDNDEFPAQFYGMLTADDLDEFIDVHERVNGVPLFNTIAASADGRAWYADTSATPNLSNEALAAYEVSLATDPVVAIAADNGAVLLDGSDPMFEWIDEEGARDPGLVPAADQPQIEQRDYLFNANDSFWVPHATALLEGDYSPLHGRQGTARSPRTRENAVVLDDMSAEGASGDDGLFTLDELADASLQNRGFTARELLAAVVARCQAAGTTPIAVPAVEPPAPGPVPAPSTTVPPPGLPAATIDISPACEVLAGWDGVYDLDRAGPPVWREMISRFGVADLREAGPLWAAAFDPTQPIATPNGLAPAPDGGPAADPVLQNLARAVQVLEVAGVPVDATLGDAQFAWRDGERIPIHGGNAFDGTTNVVGFGSGASILDPELTGRRRELVAPGSSLARIDGETGYPVNNGTSFLMALAFTEDGPEARTFLTYGGSEDRSNPDYTAATERFSDKEWRAVPFTQDEVEEATTEVVTVRG
jgi:acyl-homoserine-lactone acylase